MNFVTNVNDLTAKLVKKISVDTVAIDCVLPLNESEIMSCWLMQLMSNRAAICRIN